MPPSVPLDAQQNDGRYAVGIDVGGTKIAAGIVDLVTGAVIGRRQVATEFERGGAAILADTVGLAHDVSREAKSLGLPVKTMGVGVAELVDLRGRVFSDHRIRWSGLDVAGHLGAVLPTVISADVRAAALAEARLGMGRGLSAFYYATIGTGIAGVLVLNSVPYAGSRGAALVIANSMDRRRCQSCGHPVGGMVEDIASGPALAAAFGVPTAEDVVAAAQGGDARALHIIDQAAAELGHVLALLADSLDPQSIILGGGLGCAAGPYFDALTRAIRRGLWDGVPNPLPITRAALGPDAGLIGAACFTTLHATLPNDQPNQSH